MESFADCDFNITAISLICQVFPGMGTPLHKNRAFHGLVYYIDNPCLFIFQDGRIVRTPNNSVIYLPQHSAYRVESSNAGTRGCIAVNFTVAETLNLDGFSITVKNKPKLLGLFHRAEILWRTKPKGYAMACKALLYEIILLLQKEMNLDYVSSSKLARIFPAVEYIKEQYDKETISISVLANMCNMSPEYFRAIFKAQFGTSPLKYINSLKIARAKELIVSGMYSVTEAARMTGFRDDCSFRREFKKQTGRLPGELKKERGI